MILTPVTSGDAASAMPQQMVESEQDLLSAIDGLVTSWREVQSHDSTFGQRDRRPNRSRFVVIFGLAAHVHRLAATIVQLRAEGRSLEAMPLVRLAYESAVTAIWLAQNEEAALALYNEELRTLRSSALTMRSTSSDRFRAFADELDDKGYKFLPTSSDVQGKAFHARCDDLTPGGADIYIHYRLLCKYAHASVSLIENYVQITDDGRDEIALGVDPSPEDDTLWLFYTLQALVWAGTAVDYIEPARHRRSHLRDVARRFKFARDLHLTPEAHQRVQRALRERRLDGRKKRNAPGLAE